uniref:Protein yippee-like n=1 Tax=Ascaris lumbricoides TaxID=6252 RepID=A0A0M3HVY7_ASCLU
MHEVFTVISDTCYHEAWSMQFLLVDDSATRINSDIKIMYAITCKGCDLTTKLEEALVSAVKIHNTAFLMDNVRLASFDQFPKM